VGDLYAGDLYVGDLYVGDLMRARAFPNHRAVMGPCASKPATAVVSARSIRVN
jgi:hypothetical protein